MVSKELKNPVIKIFEHAGVGAGTTFSGSWDADEDYVIRHILIKANGAAPTKSTITIRVDNTPITKDKALCNTFGTNAQDALLLNIPLKKGHKFDYEGTNNEGAAADFTIELVMEKTG
jgi:hypothetical protein